MEEAIAHEGYVARGNENSNRYHDIAIIRLREPVQEFTEFISPVCLPTQGEESRINDILYVAGWGATGK